jgi:hypothetical protein
VHYTIILKEEKSGDSIENEPKIYFFMGVDCDFRNF